MQRHTLQCSSRCVYEMKEGSCACPAVPAPNADADTDCGPLVGYQIRFDSSTVGVDTKIKWHHIEGDHVQAKVKLRYSNGFIAVINRLIM